MISGIIAKGGGPPGLDYKFLETTYSRSLSLEAEAITIFAAAID